MPRPGTPMSWLPRLTSSWAISPAERKLSEPGSPSATRAWPSNACAGRFTCWSRHPNLKGKYMKTLYRVVECFGSNQGYRHMEEHGRSVLYCGYDRLEAVRIFHESTVSDHDRGPGSQGRETLFEAGEI